MTRRSFLPSAAGAALAARGAAAAPLKGRIKQSVCTGVFGRGKTLDDCCQLAQKMGIKGIDLVRVHMLPTVLKYGLIPTMIGGPSDLKEGIIRPGTHEAVEKAMHEAIDAGAAAGCPNVIILSGERRGMSDEQGMDTAVKFIDRLKKHAEDKGVTICMELLNSKVNHPDYMCDRTKWGVEMCKRVNSPRVKLLYDIYHMQIMEGDIIRTIRQNIQWIGHFHTAGNPGRNEPDESQELNYAAIAKAIADLNYTGWVAHEYGPKKDPIQSLEHTLQIFDA